MADALPSLAEEEYRALRATIRERGTARSIVMTLTVVSWAAFSLWLNDSGRTPLLSLVALVMLDAGFEAVFSMHVGVERIGRYLQVRYESPDGPRWEHTAMASPPPAASKPVDALFSPVFLVAVGLNLVLACWTGVAGLPLVPDGSDGVAAWNLIALVELAVVFVGHLALVARILGARRFAAGQRQRELEFFKTLAR